MREDRCGYEKAGPLILSLLSALPLATKVAKAAKEFHARVHNCDRADLLVRHAAQEKPLFVILDWDGCEAEAFRVLKEFGLHEDLRKVPLVGFLSDNKQALKEEAQRTGCDRVYSKTEFFRNLNELFVRYAR